MCLTKRLEPLFKKPEYSYTEQALMRFLFKLDDSIEVNIRPVTLNDEDPEYTTTGIALIYQAYT